MFRPMRRKDKGISIDAAKYVLSNSRRGVLAVNGDDGYPYSIPINYFYDENKGKIFFHSAKAGHKADSIKKCDKVCFTVISDPEIRDVSWAPYLKSALIFGRCRLIEDREEVMKLVRKFAMKYYPNEKLVDEEIQSTGAAVQIFEITIEHITGKEIQER